MGDTCGCCLWEPRLKHINAALAFKDSRITWRHMANQISCYGLAEEPGTAYTCNDWQMALFWDTLFTKVYGVSHATADSQVLRPLLTDLIGCQDNPTVLAFGEGDRPGRLAISPRDFARFDLLYLRGGKWGDRQLLCPEYARLAVTSPVPNSVPRAGDGRSAGPRSGRQLQRHPHRRPRDGESRLEIPARCRESAVRAVTKSGFNSS